MIIPIVITLMIDSLFPRINSQAYYWTQFYQDVVESNLLIFEPIWLPNCAVYTSSARCNNIQVSKFVNETMFIYDRSPYRHRIQHYQLPILQNSITISSHSGIRPDDILNNFYFDEKNRALRALIFSAPAGGHAQFASSVYFTKCQNLNFFKN